MFTDQDLFVDGQVPTYDCANMDEDNDGIVDDLDLCPGTLQYFVENGQVDENGCSPDSLPPSTSLSPTSSPITAPTTSPTLTASPTSSTLPFQDIGNNGSPAEVFPLGECQGDCDNDGECQVCFGNHVSQHSFASFIDLILNTLCVWFILVQSSGGPSLLPA